MKKTGDFVKLKDKSMYFPKVELTYDELYTLYVYGHAKPYFLRQIVVNIDMLENIITKNSKNRPNEKDGYKYLLGKLRRFGNFQDKSNMFIDYPLTRERINAKQSVSRLWGKACVLENVGRKMRGLGVKITKIDK